jgi:hypothetical protein
MNERSPLLEGALRLVYEGFVPGAFTNVYTASLSPNGIAKVVGVVVTNTGVVNCNFTLASRPSSGTLAAAQWNKIDTYPMLGKETVWLASELEFIPVGPGGFVDIAASITSALSLSLVVREL